MRRARKALGAAGKKAGPHTSTVPASPQLLAARPGEKRMFLQRSPRGVLDGVPLLETAHPDFLGLNGDEGFGEGGVF